MLAYISNKKNLYIISTTALTGGCLYAVYYIRKEKLDTKLYNKIKNYFNKNGEKKL